MAVQKAKRAQRPVLTPETVESEVTDLVQHIKANPLLYLAGVAFVVVCILASFLYRHYSAERETTAATLLAKALANEDPSLRVTELEPLTLRSGDLTPKATYLLGESAYQAENYDKAKAAFERVLTEFSDSGYAPDAEEGLGYILENKGENENAIQQYGDIKKKWPTSFTARRQSFNIARCQVKLERLSEAVSSYQDQVSSFPDSETAKEAQSELAKLKDAHPELFPAPTTAAASIPVTGQPTAAAPAEPPAGVVEIPADAAQSSPAATTPATEQAPATPQGQ